MVCGPHTTHLALFPGHSHCQFSITCSIKKRWGKAWDKIAREWHQCPPGGEREGPDHKNAFSGRHHKQWVILLRNSWTSGKLRILLTLRSSNTLVLGRCSVWHSWHHHWALVGSCVLALGLTSLWRIWKPFPIVFIQGIRLETLWSVSKAV